MSHIMMVGVSHATAPVDVVERIAPPVGALDGLVNEVFSWDNSAGAMILATCNRTEIYVEYSDSDFNTERLLQLLAKQAAVDTSEFSSYFYIHHADQAVHHLFNVASGLDSVVIGEDQILGQVRDALKRSQRLGAAGPTLNRAVQEALRVGKESRSAQGLNRAGRSLATVGISWLQEEIGPLVDTCALIIGAGSMGSVVASALRQAEVKMYNVANRTPERAQRLAEVSGGRGASLEEIPELLVEADVVVACVGGTDAIVKAADVAQAMKLRAGRHLYMLDLALTRNIDKAVDDIDGVIVIDLQRLADAGDDTSMASVDAAMQMVQNAVSQFCTDHRGSRAIPVLTAMRSAAREALEAELSRLSGRVPSLDKRASEEVAHSMHRLVNKLMHLPTVRAQEMAGMPEGAVYMEVMKRLFDTGHRERNSGEAA